MRKIIFILILLPVTFSCKNEQSKIIQEIAPVDANWIKGSPTYWIEDEIDSIWTEIEFEDASKHSKYWKCNEFNLELSNNLSIKKTILIDPETGAKDSETVEYSKKINENLKTLISLRYDYKSESYFTFLIDSIASEKKRNQNQIKLDSLYKYAEENNLYLCGTAANEILFEGLPEFPIPRIISLDSTLLIIKNWKKNSL
ncbi:hypothetical protein [Aquimarina rubra]|uniref:Uncharacterized protein n=1 Tax=Aquimarina rubra TaxID=1920033 RepID=A0ABW5LDI3_9FLAO